jgi:hypothetical protein
VDVFRVTGGTNHDYTFHGAIRWTQSGVCSFPLVTNNNQYPMLEPGDPAWSLSTDTPYYGFFRGISSNTAPGNFYLTYLDTNRSTARDTRLWMTADPNVYNVYLGWTPVPARDNTVPTNFFNYLNLTRPSAVIRHRVASGPLSDLFVSVVEPINAGTTNIVSVQRLPMNGSSTESCALQITFNDGRVDTYVVNLQNPKVAGSTGGSASVSTADGTYALNGRIGVEMDRPNADSRVWTVNATDFKYPHRELSTPANTYYSGLVSGSTRIFDGAAYNAFTTTTPLPTGTALRGKSFSLTHGTLSGSGTTNISEMYVIDQVVLSNGFYYVCFTNDHYLEITNGVTSVEQVAPLRTFTTSNSFEIALTAFAGQISSIADQNITPSGSSGPISFNFGNLGTTSGSSLQVLASSSNPTLVPNGNIVIGGSGTNRTVTISPAAGQTGTSVITLSVTDGTWTNSRSFNAIVATYALRRQRQFHQCCHRDQRIRYRELRCDRPARRCQRQLQSADSLQRRHQRHDHHHHLQHHARRQLSAHRHGHSGTPGCLEHRHARGQCRQSHARLGHLDRRQRRHRQLERLRQLEFRARPGKFSQFQRSPPPQCRQ